MLPSDDNTEAADMGSKTAKARLSAVSIHLRPEEYVDLPSMSDQTKAVNTDAQPATAMLSASGIHLEAVEIVELLSTSNVNN